MTYGAVVAPTEPNPEEGKQAISPEKDFHPVSLSLILKSENAKLL